MKYNNYIAVQYKTQYIFYSHANILFMTTICIYKNNLNWSNWKDKFVIIQQHWKKIVGVAIRTLTYLDKASAVVEPKRFYAALSVNTSCSVQLSRTHAATPCPMVREKSRETLRGSTPPKIVTKRNTYPSYLPANRSTSRTYIWTKTKCEDLLNLSQVRLDESNCAATISNFQVESEL